MHNFSLQFYKYILCNIWGHVYSNNLPIIHLKVKLKEVPCCLIWQLSQTTSLVKKQLLIQLNNVCKKWPRLVANSGIGKRRGQRAVFSLLYHLQ